LPQQILKLKIMKNTLTVERVTNEQVDFNIGFDFNTYRKRTDDDLTLFDFLPELRVIQTHKKWGTWGRMYIQVPSNVLEKFGVITTSPITFYVNYVYFKAMNFMYMGSIFSGDAAWFDTYHELDVTNPIDVKIIKDSASFKMAYDAMNELTHRSNEGEGDARVTLTFLDWIDDPMNKWSVVPVNNRPPSGPQGKNAVVFYRVNNN
jgi:hypothetical protein